jgi:protein-disulfide isomerase
MKSGIIGILAAFSAGLLVGWGATRVTLHGGTSTDAEVLAVVGGEPLTRADVESGASNQFRQARQQLFDLTDRSLQQAIDAKLIDMEAKARGISRDSLLAAEVESGVPAPSDAAVDSVYALYKDQINQPLEQAAPRIRAFLSRDEQRNRYQALVAALAAKYPVENRLEPPRFDVDAKGFPAKGPEDAPVTLVEFSDFQCPFCLRVAPTLDRIVADYGDEVRLVYRQLPLTSIHPHAQKAAEASLCAADQGKFWEMHDAMFGAQNQLDVASLKQTAAGLGMDAGAFDQCLDSGAKAGEVAADVQVAQQLGLSGTPAIFINGRYLNGAQPYDVISSVIDDELRRLGS